MKSSKGYADFRGMTRGGAAEGKKSGNYVDELSRLLLFVILLVAFVVGYILHSRANQPMRVIRSSVERTLGARYSASIEGNSTIGDSLLAEYRVHETYSPDAGISAAAAPGDSAPPTDSRRLLENLLVSSRAKELKREDMYGHPTRHYYGDLPNAIETGSRVSSMFEYWLDTRSRDAVRLMVTTVKRGAAVSAEGDTLSQAIFLNIRFSR